MESVSFCTFLKVLSAILHLLILQQPCSHWHVAWITFRYEVEIQQETKSVGIDTCLSYARLSLHIAFILLTPGFG